LLTHICLARSDVDACALCDEPLRNHLADTARSARDERNAAFEREQIVHGRFHRLLDERSRDLRGTSPRRDMLKQPEARGERPGFVP
jgi:hypothetical protein